MNFEEAKEAIKTAGKLYRAYYEGSVWSAGRMVDVGETIGYFLTEEEAKKACSDFELFDFDKEHLQTAVDEVYTDEFTE